MELFVKLKDWIIFNFNKERKKILNLVLYIYVPDKVACTFYKEKSVIDYKENFDNKNLYYE